MAAGATWAAAALALLLLNASLTFTNVWPTPRIRWGWTFSVELAALVLLVAIAPQASRWLARRVLPVVWVALVAGRYLAVTGPGLYGRDFNLYWDAPHLGNVAAMLARAVPVWMVAAAAGGGLLTLALAYLAARAAWQAVAVAAQARTGRIVLAGTAAGVLLAFTAQAHVNARHATARFADPVTPALARQARYALALTTPGPAIGETPAELGLPLGLGGADVFIVFVESYGAVTYDHPEFAGALAESRARFDQAARTTGRAVVSAFIDPPTFGASSWLSHLSLMTGLDVRDQYVYTRVMASSRETLARVFRRHGYRAVALMPGMRQPWPEGAFYGFDEIYGRVALDYRGPQFGWWSIPDQYALAKLDALERARPDRVPLFAIFPTSNTHAPFGPVPPYQPDWTRMLTPDPFDAREAEAALAARPDLLNLAPSYLRATEYQFVTFAGYLEQHADDDLVLILVGDHQPPSAVSGPDAPWDVPVHVVARQHALLARLVEAGFRPGMTPMPPAATTMHGLTAALMTAFADDR